MVKVESINGKESEYIEKTISRLISSHNTFAQVCELFDNDITIMEYFEAAKEEVLEAGNCGLGTMMVIALENMAERLRDLEEETDESDIEKLQFKIYKLESENRKLKAKLDSVYKALGIEENKEN